MVLYPNKLPESERVCSGICTVTNHGGLSVLDIKAMLRESANPLAENAEKYKPIF